LAVGNSALTRVEQKREETAVESVTQQLIGIYRELALLAIRRNLVEPE
jgi:hypothetical protein